MFYSAGVDSENLGREMVLRHDEANGCWTINEKTGSLLAEDIDDERSFDFMQPGYLHDGTKQPRPESGDDRRLWMASHKDLGPQDRIVRKHGMDENIGDDECPNSSCSERATSSSWGSRNSHPTSAVLRIGDTVK